MRVLISGASGFIGRAVAKAMLIRGFTVRAAVREHPKALVLQELRDIEIALVGELSGQTDWREAMVGVDCVVHCAARAHVMHESPQQSLNLYRQVNVDGSRRLATAAAAAGVRRLVFLSSIGVNGRRTAVGKPFTAADKPAPEDAYSISKCEAENELRDIAENGALEVVIVRPPLVYGPGAKGTVPRLLKAIQRRWPLPLGAVNNSRSFVALDNVVDLLLRAAEHPKAANRTFLVSDDEDISVPDFLRSLGQAIDRPARLFSVPVPFLRFGGHLLGKQLDVERLVSNLQVDIAYTRETLGWSPVVTVGEGIRRMVEPL